MIAEELKTIVNKICEALGYVWRRTVPWETGEYVYKRLIFQWPTHLTTGGGRSP